MKNFRRIISALLLLCVIISLLPSISFARAATVNRRYVLDTDGIDPGATYLIVSSGAAGSANALRLNTVRLKEKKKKVEKKYPWLKNKKVILFAPTYRGTRVNDADYGFEHLDLDEVYKKYKDEYVFIFKWHPALYNNILNGKREGYNLEKYNGFYQDLSCNKGKVRGGD